MLMRCFMFGSSRDNNDLNLGNGPVNLAESKQSALVESPAYEESKEKERDKLMASKVNKKLHKRGRPGTFFTSSEDKVIRESKKMVEKIEKINAQEEKRIQKAIKIKDKESGGKSNKETIRTSVNNSNIDKMKLSFICNEISITPSKRKADDSDDDEVHQVKRTKQNLNGKMWWIGRF